MNDKITTQRLAELLVEKSGVGQNNAENFLKTMFGLIESALKDEKYVKIKGLGTFKIIEVDSRESIDVNTNERIRIEGHSKISFLPDPTLRENINKPFSHFETVVLNDNVQFDESSLDKDADEDLQDEDVEEGPEDDLNEGEEESTSENKEEVLPSAEKPETGLAAEPVITEPDPNVTPEPVDVPVAETVTELVAEPVKETVSESSAVQPDQPVKEPIKETVEESTVEPPKEEQQSKPKTWDEFIDTSSPESIYKQEKASLSEKDGNDGSVKNYALHFAITLTLLLFVVGGGLIIYFCYPQLFPNHSIQPIAGDSILSNSRPKGVPNVQPSLSLQDSIILLRKQLVNAESRQRAFTGDTVVTPDAGTTAKSAALKEDRLVAKKTVKIEKDKIAEQKKAEQEKVVKEKATKDKIVKEKTNITVDGYTIEGTQQTVTLEPGQTLVSLSKKYYGTKGLWTVIAKYNKNTIKDPDNVPFGSQIKIPRLKKK
jgi:nucleoid DNA-binding protein